MFSACPEVLQYKIDFANDWAQELTMKVSASVPSDALLPDRSTLRRLTTFRN